MQHEANITLLEMSYRSRAQWDFWIQFHSDYSIPFRFPNLNLKSVHMCFLQFFSFTIVQISQTSTKFCSKVPVCKGNLTICVKMAQSGDKKQLLLLSHGSHFSDQCQFPVSYIVLWNWVVQTFFFCGSIYPKLCNQVPSLSLSRWRTLTLLKI